MACLIVTIHGDQGGWVPRGYDVFLISYRYSYMLICLLISMASSLLCNWQEMLAEGSVDEVDKKVNRAHLWQNVSSILMFFLLLLMFTGG